MGLAHTCATRSAHHRVGRQASCAQSKDGCEARNITDLAKWTILMHLDTYFAALQRAHDGVLPLNDDQQQAIRHGYDRPLWIIAGPGTGKTHTLVWLVLKRILV